VKTNWEPWGLSELNLALGTYLSAIIWDAITWNGIEWKRQLIIKHKVFPSLITELHNWNVQKIYLYAFLLNFQFQFSDFSAFVFLS